MKIFFSILLFFLAISFSGCVFDEAKEVEINLKEDISKEAGVENKEEFPDQQNEEKEEVFEKTEVAVEEIEKIENKEKEETENKSPEIEEKKEVEVEKKPEFKISERFSSWGFTQKDSRKIDTIVIHSSYNALDKDSYNLDKIIAIYKSYGVAPHYIISREGKIYQMVEDKNIAYHAGESKMSDGRTNVNNFSLGIEIVNSKTEGPNNLQYSSLKNLLNYLKKKHQIKYTVGHSDISPGRKDDPWKFDWSKIK